VKEGDLLLAKTLWSIGAGWVAFVNITRVRICSVPASTTNLVVLADAAFSLKNVFLREAGVVFGLLYVLPGLSKAVLPDVSKHHGF